MSKFSTLNESSLHSSLKTYYCVHYNGKTEIKEDGHIYDIVTDSGEIIEIQTKNLSKLKSKLTDILERGKKVKLVHPVIKRNTIYLTNQEGKLISKRNSPKKENIYDIFREITGLTDILLNENFSLDIVEINQSEHRVRTDEPVQTKNKQRRFKKNWIKVDKHLDDLLEIKTFKEKNDYLSLLPDSLPEEFTVSDLKQSLLDDGQTVRSANNSNLIVWVLRNMGLITQTGNKGKAYVYKIVDKS